jgi:hypothetical protein
MIKITYPSKVTWFDLHIGVTEMRIEMNDLNYWNPEDPKFWETKGKRVASRNLWISIPNLLIAFCVWQIWSILSLKLIDVGFNYTTEQVFTLTAIPALTGAVLLEGCGKNSLHPVF